MIRKQQKPSRGNISSHQGGSSNLISIGKLSKEKSSPARARHTLDAAGVLKVKKMQKVSQRYLLPKYSLHAAVIQRRSGTFKLKGSRPLDLASERSQKSNQQSIKEESQREESSSSDSFASSKCSDITSKKSQSPQNKNKMKTEPSNPPALLRLKHVPKKIQDRHTSVQSLMGRH